jgi:hypothetical protein
MEGDLMKILQGIMLLKFYAFWKKAIKSSELSMPG